jgi:hypothetical protein
MKNKDEALEVENKGGSDNERKILFNKNCEV